MTRSYWLGVGLAGIVCIVATVSLRAMRSGAGAADDLPLVIDPPFVAASEPWILPGASREFTVTLRNQARKTAWIEELRFSCPCAEGRIDGSARLPLSIPAGGAVPLTVAATSRREVNGAIELRFGVVGRIDDQPVQAGAAAGLHFVQHLNADPAWVAFGSMSGSEEPRSTTVDLWYPADGQPPDSVLTIEADDPSVSSQVDRIPNARAVDDGPNRRLVFARLTVTVDPRIAPERMKAHVVVRSGDDALRIPVLGFVSHAAAGTPPG